MLTKAERETTILMNDEDDYAIIWTCQRKIMNIMKRRGVKPIRQDEDGARYKVPVKWIKISPPRKASKKQREIATQNIAKIHQKTNDSTIKTEDKIAG